MEIDQKERQIKIITISILEELERREICTEVALAALLSAFVSVVGQINMPLELFDGIIDQARKGYIRYQKIVKKAAAEQKD